MTSAPAISGERLGLARWMQEALDQCAKAENGFGADPVHDLRTSLRRCRSIADTMKVFDRDARWKKMKRAGRELFKSLGALRDAHVVEEWVEKLAPEDDPARKVLSEHLVGQEKGLKDAAASTLQKFDRKQWQRWTDELPSRATRIPIDSPVLAHFALERWDYAYSFHRRAMRNRTNIAFHETRIGLKRFRYTLENFLPALHKEWGEDLKELQDLLGEVHDLDVLWQTALNIRAFPDLGIRAEWRGRVEREREERLRKYREKMVGPDSHWRLWRARLPEPNQLRELGLERMKIWASYLDPEFVHAKHTARLALQLYDGLQINGVASSKRETYREVLHAAALVHDVGLASSTKGHHKVSARQIRKLDVPLGWTSSEVAFIALIARYHRGALPRETQNRFSALSPARRRLVQFLAGILRLACACDCEHNRQIRRVKVEGDAPVVTIQADGYAESSDLAEHLAAARHLLELAFQRPVFLVPASTSHQSSAA